MRSRATLALLLLMPMGSASTSAQELIVSRAGSRPLRSGPATNFTGDVRVEMLSEAVPPAQASVGSVTFAPGARTAWHSHPRGQILFVTAGTGRVQRWGDAIVEVHEGDVVRIPPGQKHWHGAAPRSPMTHIAVTEQVDGTAVEWMEQVSDEQYGGPAGRADANGPSATPARPSGPLQQKVAPGLAALTDDVLFGDVWRRPDLSPRDRSLVTIAVLIAIGKPAQLGGHLGRGLDNGLRASETSGLLGHLAVYAGWPAAVSALEVYDQVYTARRIDPTSLRVSGPAVASSVWHAAQAKAMRDELGSKRIDTELS